MTTTTSHSTLSLAAHAVILQPQTASTPSSVDTQRIVLEEDEQLKYSELSFTYILCQIKAPTHFRRSRLTGIKHKGVDAIISEHGEEIRSLLLEANENFSMSKHNKLQYTPVSYTSLLLRLCALS